ncbi:MAG: amidohydrolase family protein [Gemmatimonadetes bacterium]|nr:amidohydrolase family protein [Gemmatimonadota bacterium]
MRRLSSAARVSTSLLLCAFVRVAHAQSPTAPPSSPVVLRAQRLIVGDGTTIDQPVVIVQGDRIIAAGPASSVAVPRGARVIDLPGHTLLPGLIDSHTHINSSDSDGGDMAVLRETGAHAAIYGVVNAKKTLDAGFTTIRDVGATNYADIALRDLIAKGVVPGPRIFAAGPSLGITGGHADVNGWSPLIQIPGTGMIVDGVEGMRKAVRQNIKFGSDHIKITATGGILSVGDAVNHAQYSEEELRAAVEEAARLGRKVAMHAHGAEGIVTAVRAGAASIEHGSLIDDAGIALMKEKGTFLVPTLIILDEIARDGEKKGVPANSIAKARAIEAIGACACARRGRPGCGSPSAPTPPATSMGATPRSSPSWSTSSAPRRCRPSSRRRRTPRRSWELRPTWGLSPRASSPTSLRSPGIRSTTCAAWSGWTS